MIAKPQPGTDSRTLYKNVVDLVKGVNGLLNMSALMRGGISGVGRLRLAGNRATLYIYTENQGNAGQRSTPTIVIASTQNPSTYGTPIHWAATVRGGATPTGTVQFLIDNRNFGSPATLDGNGVATSATKSDLLIGNHTITAIYSGDASHNPVTAVFIQRISGTVTLTITSSMNPVFYGQPVHWSVDVNYPPGNPLPTGDVTFYLDGAVYAIRTLNQGHCQTLDKRFLISEAGNHLVHAHYAGDSHYAGADVSLIQTVLSTVTPDVDVISSSNPSDYGTPISFQAVLSDPTAGGSVQFTIDGVNFGGPRAVVGGIATSLSTSTQLVGHHTIGALYSGDGLHNPASGSMVQRIGGTVTVTLDPNINPAHPGDQVRWTIIVAADGVTGNPKPTGTVSLFVDNDPYGVYTLDADANALSNVYIFSTNQTGNRQISAHYNGDVNYEEADGADVETVLGGAILDLQIVPNPSPDASPIDFYLSVDGTPTPTGTVQLRLNGAAFGSPTALDGSGNAHYRIASMSLGSYAMDFTYSGDVNYAAGNSPDVTLVIQSAAYPCVFGFVNQVGLNWPGAAGGDSVFVDSGTSAGPRVSLYDTPTFYGWDGAGNLVYQGFCRVRLYPQNGPDPTFNHGAPIDMSINTSTPPLDLYPFVGVPNNAFLLEIDQVPFNLGIAQYHCDVDLCVRLPDGSAVQLNTGQSYARTTFNSFGR